MSQIPMFEFKNSFLLSVRPEKHGPYQPHHIVAIRTDNLPPIEWKCDLCDYLSDHHIQTHLTDHHEDQTIEDHDGYVLWYNDGDAIWSVKRTNGDKPSEIRN